MIRQPNDPSNQDLLDQLAENMMRVEKLEDTVTSFVTSVRHVLKTLLFIVTPFVAGFMIAFGNYIFHLFFK